MDVMQLWQCKSYGQPAVHWLSTHLQQMGELGVSVRYMCALAGKGGEDIPKAAEALVDAAGLLLPLACHF